MCEQACIWPFDRYLPFGLVWLLLQLSYFKKSTPYIGYIKYARISSLRKMADANYNEFSPKE